MHDGRPKRAAPPIPANAQSGRRTARTDQEWTLCTHPIHDLNLLVLGNMKKSPGPAGALHLQNCHREAWFIRHQTPATRKPGLLIDRGLACS